MKVDVCDIEWESYEGDDYDEEYGEGNDKGWPDCDCPTTVTLDIDVPDVMPGDDFRGYKNPMSFDPQADLLKTRPVKKGETFDLTRFETGVFISREEINARVLGNPDLKVAGSYTVTKKNGSNLKEASAVRIPTVSLRGLEGKSVKDAPFIEVLKYTSTPSTGGKGLNLPTVKRTIIPGFEKWAKLCEESVRVSSSGSSSTGNKRNDGARMFLEVLQKKANK